MAARTKFTLREKQKGSYLCLIVAFPLASIHSDEHLEASEKVMDRLLAKGNLDEGEDMYLDALSDLVAAYEDEHHSISPASDAEILLHLMESKGINQSQLHRDAAIPKSTISEVLAGKKPFSRQVIRKLAELFRCGRERAGRKSLGPLRSLLERCLIRRQQTTEAVEEDD
ncbi:MAG: helix-turn-helix domain-containing protein [Pirellulaceae bacterium]|nr:helix-turn-helix domain-containing protein [Pirellulaceae bacterium]